MAGCPNRIGPPLDDTPVKLFIHSLPISFFFSKNNRLWLHFILVLMQIAGEAELAGELAQVRDDFHFSNWISWRVHRAGHTPVDCIWVCSFKLQRFTDFHSLRWRVKALLRIGKLEENHQVTSNRKCRWKIWTITTVMMLWWHGSIWGDVDFII